MRDARMPVTAIAEALGRHRSTIHREIRRNSYDLAARMSALRVSSPYPMDLIAAFQVPYHDCGGHKTAIHPKLWRHHLRGEWFSARVTAEAVCAKATRVVKSEVGEREARTLSQAVQDGFGAARSTRAH